ncbi:MAG: hypothetical protein LBJ67_09905 [Planctomycetaceae bacterium]|jgi:hypothetical protein|nr:hypothetical protein [Planctomycetaceae bacterium]
MDYVLRLNNTQPHESIKSYNSNAVSFKLEQQKISVNTKDEFVSTESISDKEFSVYHKANFKLAETSEMPLIMQSLGVEGLQHITADSVSYPNAKHINLLAWSLGIKNPAQEIYGNAMYNAASFRGGKGVVGLTQEEVRRLRSEYQLETQDLDQTITSLLEKNGITLASNEQLDFFVNQDNKITVKPESIKEEAKRTKIEEILNAQNGLAERFLMLHAKKAITDSAANAGFSQVRQATTILYDGLLQRETGSGLSDVTVITEPDAEPRFISRSGNTTLDNLLAEESLLRDDIQYIMEQGNVAYQAEFSYKNGVVIDQQLAGQTAMLKRLQEHNRFGKIGVSGSYTATLSETGNLLSSTLAAAYRDFDKNNSINFETLSAMKNIMDGWTTQRYHHILPGDYSDHPQIFAEDAFRLYQFQNGAAENAEYRITIQNTNGVANFQVITV